MAVGAAFCLCEKRAKLSTRAHGPSFRGRGKCEPAWVRNFWACTLTNLVSGCFFFAGRSRCLLATLHGQFSRENGHAIRSTTFIHLLAEVPPHTLSDAGPPTGNRAGGRPGAPGAAVGPGHPGAAVRAGPPALPPSRGRETEPETPAPRPPPPPPQGGGGAPGGVLRGLPGRADAAGAGGARAAGPAGTRSPSPSISAPLWHCARPLRRPSVHVDIPAGPASSSGPAGRRPRSARTRNACPPQTPIYTSVRRARRTRRLTAAGR